MFNTLQYAKKLEEAGVSREGDVATKQDIKEVKDEMIKLGALVTAIIATAVTILKVH